jgi:serine/threonine-protein kinase
MSSGPGPRYEDLSADQLRQVDAICNRFEDAWKAGQRPVLEEYLRDVPEPVRSVLLADLIVLDVEGRRQAGEDVRPEDYRDRTGAIAPLPRTRTFRPGPAPARHESPPQPRAFGVSLAPGSAPHLSDDTRNLLRKRERALVLFLLVGFASYFLKDLITGNFDDALDMGISALFLVPIGICTVILWSRRTLALFHLRILELVIVSVVTVSFARVHLDWFEANGPYQAATATPNSDVVQLAAAGSVLRWFALILGYGLFIPNTWRRCGAVVGVLTGLPFVLTIAAGLRNGNLHLFRDALLEMAFWLGTAAAAAIYGCHKISELRAQAFEARKLGQYRLKERLGAGGMGEVYLAEHVLLRRPCAVKLIRPEQVGDPASLSRFEREVRATARLTHPNTVEIYDYGHAMDGTFYYAMEYLPGLTLERLVRVHGPLPPARVVHLLRQVCAALQEAHGLGLIHRDVKPGNLMLCERGGVPDVVKLLDFGLVRAVGPATDLESLTHEGALVGTPAYMSPEQCRGKDDLDARSDIYSLGAVAYFLLTGQPPFADRKGIRVIFAHLDEPVVPPSQRQAGLPEDLEAVVMRCLEKDPTKRFPDAASLESALAGCGCAAGWTVAQASDWWHSQGLTGPPARPQ